MAAVCAATLWWRGRPRSKVSLDKIFADNAPL
jgi:hypothetical protein